MSRPDRNRAMTALTLLVVLFSTAAFVFTQVKKQEEVPITGIEFDRELDPGCDCPREEVRLSFVLKRSQPVTATLIGEDEAPVRTLLDSERRPSGRETLRWDGTDDEGQAVPGGDYRLEIDLATPERTVVIPNEVRVEESG